MKCEIEGCENAAKYAGLCGMHYKRQWRHGDPNKTLTPTRGFESKKCIVEDCENMSDYSSGFCELHYTRWRCYGRTHKIVNRGSGWAMNGAGYILLSINGTRVYEHIYKAERALGKPLPKGAVVHHMNNKPWDNDTPFNLIVCPNQAYHLLLHRRMKELGYGQDN